MKKVFGYVIAVCFLAVFFCLGSIEIGEAAPASAEPYKIGFSDGFSGTYAANAMEARAGAEIAVDEINDRGGILGRPIKLVIRDDKSQGEGALRNAKELVLAEKVNALMGSTSSTCALAVSPYAKEKKVLFITQIAQSEHLTGKLGHRYYFRFTTSTYMYSYGNAHAAATLPITKWWLLNPDYEYGHASYDRFRKMLKELKPEVEFVGESWPKLGETDYTPFLTQILSSEAKGVFSTVAGGDFARMYKSAKGLGFFEKVTLVSNDLGYIASYYMLGKEMPEGIMGGTHYPYWVFEGNPKNKEFHKKVMDKIGRPPSLAGVQGYESVWAVVRSAQKAGSTDTEKIIDALEGAKLDTLAGPVTVRKFDHQVTWPLWFGKTKLMPGYPWPILVDLIKYQDEGYPTEAEIRESRAAK
jgi:branched-chain amino acid transport system substrate-binding protein